MFLRLGITVDLSHWQSKELKSKISDFDKNHDWFIFSFWKLFLTPATPSQRHKVDLSFNQYENCLRSNNRKEGNLNKLQRNKKRNLCAQHWCVGSGHAWWLWETPSPAWPSTSPPSRSSPTTISRLPGDPCHCRFWGGFCCLETKGKQVVINN